VLESISPEEAYKYETHLANVAQGSSGWVLAAPARAYFVEKANMQVTVTHFSTFYSKLRVDSHPHYMII